MAATARVVVLMEDSEKTELEARAKAANKSLGAYMRERALGDDDARLDQLLTLVERTTAEATASLDSTLARLAAAERDHDTLRAAARAQAIEEFRTLGPEGQASLAALFSAAPAPSPEGKVRGERAARRSAP